MSKKLEQLDKRNFWRAIKTRYPKSMTYFNLWIDSYKKYNDWGKLFNADIGYLHQWKNKHDSGGETRTTEAPKFHDLPFAMQFGIFTQFLADQSDETDDMVSNFKQIVMDCFKETERAL